MAGSEKIKISTQRLSTDADKVNRSISDIVKQLNNMENSVTQLDKMWEGESSEAFKKAFHDDIALAEKMISNLNKIYQYEENAKNKYDACENKVGQMVNNIKI